MVHIYMYTFLFFYLTFPKDTYSFTMYSINLHSTVYITLTLLYHEYLTQKNIY